MALTVGKPYLPRQAFTGWVNMGNWSEAEVELTVDDYFSMLGKEFRGERYNKSEHRKILRQHLNNRSDAAIELKHQNISAVLIESGLPHISGYKPRSNYQSLLRTTVLRKAQDFPFFPVRAYSWQILSPSVALKSMDKSSFLHQGTGVPGVFSWFFDYGTNQAPKAITLRFGKVDFDANLQPDIQHERVRLFWKHDLVREIHQRFPRLREAFSRGEVPGGDDTPLMRFEKSGTEDIYLITFLEPDNLMEEPLPPEEYDRGRREGGKRAVQTTQYERDARNRAEAIKLHGTKCCVCGFDFEEAYGDIGRGFIEIHHLNPLADLEGEQETDPRTDLVPLCSNCHRMVHRRRDRTLDIGDLKERLKR